MYTEIVRNSAIQKIHVLVFLVEVGMQDLCLPQPTAGTIAIRSGLLDPGRRFEAACARVILQNHGREGSRYGCGTGYSARNMDGCKIRAQDIEDRLTKRETASADHVCSVDHNLDPRSL